MSRIHLTESRWAFIEPLLPPSARTGRPRANDRRTLEGILYVLITGCRWHDVPREYGAPTTVWRRLRRWGEEGVWERIWRSALAALDRHGKRDWTMAFRDGSFAPAKKGGDKVGLTKKGKGTKWMLVVDGDGLPLGFRFHLASASTAEVRLAAQTLDTISVARSLAPTAVPRVGPSGWWRIARMIVIGSDAPCALRRRGMGMCIPAKRGPARWRAKRGRPIVARKEEYRLRFTVERSFAWLGTYRRLLIRWERLSAVDASWYAVAIMRMRMRMCIRRLV